jgi:hypothetical protein
MAALSKVVLALLAVDFGRPLNEEKRNLEKMHFCVVRESFYKLPGNCNRSIYQTH